MLTTCPACAFARYPYDYEQMRSDPARVLVHYACPCGRRWSRSRTRESMRAWLRGGGQWADPAPKPRETGIVCERQPSEPRATWR